MPKLRRNNQEKRSFIQISEDKIYTANLFKVCKTFNFPLFFCLISKNNKNCFHVKFQRVFISCFEQGSSLHFIHCFWFLHFLGIFVLEFINSRNIYAFFKDFMDVNMKKYFWGTWSPVNQTPRCLSIYALQKTVCPN